MFASTVVASEYDFSAEYTADLLGNVSGGVDNGTRYLDNLDLILSVDVARAWGSGSGTLFLHGLYNNGVSFSDELSGDLQVVSNIDADEAWRIFQFWYEFGSDDWSVRTGLYDLNSEFDVNETGSLFVNSSHGIGAELAQTGQNGPGIFPVSSLSVRAELRNESFTFRAAVLDAVPGDPDDAASNEIRLKSDDGYLAIAELDVSVMQPGRLRVGYWRYSAEFEQAFDNGPRLYNDGWYVGAEKRFSIGSLAAAAFARYGQADERLNAIRDYTGLGIRVDGPFSARPDDQIGLAVASARMGEPYRDHLRQQGIRSAQRETTWELTYRAQINEHLVVQPDIQCVVDPSARSESGNAWVVGIRVVIGS